MEIENCKKSTENEIWLNYFNDVLFNNGVITEKERNKMKNQINLYNMNSKNQRIKNLPK